MELQFKKKYAVVTYKTAKLEGYNPELYQEFDNIEDAEEMAENYKCLPNEDVTIVQKEEGEIIDYYSGSSFNMNSYRF